MKKVPLDLNYVRKILIILRILSKDDQKHVFLDFSIIAVYYCTFTDQL
jgi:hypothetical protein